MLIYERLAKVSERIRKACEKYQKNPNTVKLLAVSKGQPIEKIKELYDLGIRDFGENYSKELEQKADALSDLEINWHYIGHIQSNKIAKIVQHSSVIHSVAELKHASLIHKYALKYKKSPLIIFININAAKEPNKHGCNIDEARDLAMEIKNSYDFLIVEGIMVIPPLALIETEELEITTEIPDLYHKLRITADSIGKKTLSLGMSQDLELAIGAGSNLVRVGTALFGPRNSSKV